MSTGESQVEALLSGLPDHCKDLRLNLTSVLRGTSVDAATTAGSAYAAALFVGNRALADAIRADAGSHLSDDDVADAQAAASLMGMTTVYYKARDLLKKESYAQMRPSLRMNRMLSPASRQRYESFALVCAAIAGCETCLKSHEEKLLGTGLMESNVHDLLRIAAIVHGASVALVCA